MSRTWWSRLIIAVRGYVANYVQTNDEILFLTDDAFILLHQQLVESSSKDALQVSSLSFSFFFQLDFSA